MAQPGIVSIKSFSYRGAAEEWSNDYHFDGDPPGTEADWRSLCDAHATLEAACLTGGVSIVRFLCYEDTDNDSVYTYDLTAYSGALFGEISGSGAAELCPGDTAYCARWPTGRRTSTGKPIYLRKYWHGAIRAGSDPDAVYGLLQDAVSTYAEAVITTSGDWPGMVGPDGVAPTGFRAMPELTTRTLKRRGRRPT